MTACLCYRRGKDYENERQQQRVFKGPCLRLGYQPSFGALAGTPLRQESKLLSASQQVSTLVHVVWQIGSLGMALLPQRAPSPGCRAPEGLSLGSHGDPPQAHQPPPFPAAHMATCTKKHPCFRSKMFPNCICRQEAAARPWPAISAPLLSPSNTYCACRSPCPLPLSVPPLSKGN